MLDTIGHYPYLSYENNKLLIQDKSIESLSENKKTPFV